MWTRNRMIVLGLIALMGPAGPAYGDHDEKRDRGKRIDLIATCTEINDFVDVEPLGPSPGDIYVFVDELFAPDQSVQVGTATGQCNLVDPALGACAGTIVLELPSGTISIVGILYNVPGVTSVGAIVGGTGRFLGVEGEASVELGSICGPHHVTLVLRR